MKRLNIPKVFLLKNKRKKIATGVVVKPGLIVIKQMMATIAGEIF